MGVLRDRMMQDLGLAGYAAQTRRVRRDWARDGRANCADGTSGYRAVAYGMSRSAIQTAGQLSANGVAGHALGATGFLLPAYSCSRQPSP